MSDGPRRARVCDCSVWVWSFDTERCENCEQPTREIQVIATEELPTEDDVRRLGMIAIAIENREQLANPSSREAWDRDVRYLRKLARALAALIEKGEGE